MAAEPTPRIGRSMTREARIAVLEQDLAALRAIVADLQVPGRGVDECMDGAQRVTSLPAFWEGLAAPRQSLDRLDLPGADARLERPRLTLVAGGGED
jgi:hypothetical protein